VDKHHPVIALLVLFVAVLMLGAGRGTESIERMRETIADNTRVQAEMFNQNQELVRANIVMRERLIELSENLTRIQSGAQACFDRLPEAQFALNASRTAPHSRLELTDVSFGESAVVIRASEAIPGLVGPTGSMRPILDDGVIVLELPVSSVDALYPGDIIIYDLDGTRVIHRIIGLGWDEVGWYAIAKGDSNPVADPEKVRFSQVRGVVGGIIY